MAVDGAYCNICFERGSYSGYYRPVKRVDPSTLLESNFDQTFDRNVGTNCFSNQSNVLLAGLKLERVVRSQKREITLIRVLSFQERNTRFLKWTQL